MGSLREEEGEVQADEGRQPICERMAFRREEEADNQVQTLQEGSGEGTLSLRDDKEDIQIEIGHPQIRNLVSWIWDQKNRFKLKTFQQYRERKNSLHGQENGFQVEKHQRKKKRKKTLR